MAKYVYSTLSSDMKYTGWAQSADLPRIEKVVQIAGGAGIASKNLITPLGVVTKIEDADEDFLMQNVIFKRHLENGFVKISSDKADPDDVALDMTAREPSSPLQDGDFKDGEAPTTADKPGKKK